MKLPGDCHCSTSERGAKFKSKNLWHKPMQDQTYGPEYYTYFQGECVWHQGCWSVFHTRIKQYDFVYRGHTVTQRAGFSDPTIIDRINNRATEDGSLERVREYVDKVDGLIERECVNG